MFNLFKTILNVFFFLNNLQINNKNCFFLFLISLLTFFNYILVIKIFNFEKSFFLIIFALYVKTKLKGLVYIYFLILSIR